MELRDLYPEEWFVVFCDSPRLRWWQRFLRRGFRHVEMFGWDRRSGRWLVISPALDMLLVMTMDDHEFGRYRAELAKRGARILMARAGQAGPWRPRLILSCVSVVSAVLGLPAPGAVRPIALYRMLLRRGATEV